MKPSFTRRAFLRAGGFALAVPTLEALLPKRAMAAGVDPKRFVSIYLPNGTFMQPNGGLNWNPASPGVLSANALPITFAPFAANVADFTIIRGVQNPQRFTGTGASGEHSRSVASHLTCAGYSNGNSTSCTINGDSFDQALAKANGWRAIAMSAGGIVSGFPDGVLFDYGRTVSYRDGRQAQTWLNPYRLFLNLAVITPSAGPPARSQPPMLPPTLFSRNHSLLDSALEGMRRLRGEVSTNDRRRLDDYFTALRELERSLSTDAGLSSDGGLDGGPLDAGRVDAGLFDGGLELDGGGRDGGRPDAGSLDAGAPDAGGGPSCGALPNPVPQSLDNEDTTGLDLLVPARLEAFTRLLALAIQCDRARAFSFMVEREGINRRFRNQIPASLMVGNAQLDAAGSHNEVSHYAGPAVPSAAEGMNRCISRDRFYLSFAFSLANALKRVSDPSGTNALANTFIHVGTTIHDGMHAAPNGASYGLPTVLLGGHSMMSQGRSLHWTGRTAAELFFTLNQRMGGGLPSFANTSSTVPL